MNKTPLMIFILIFVAIPLQSQKGGEIQKVDFEAPMLLQLRQYQYNVYLPAGY